MDSLPTNYDVNIVYCRSILVAFIDVRHSSYVNLMVMLSREDFNRENVILGGKRK